MRKFLLLASVVGLFGLTEATKAVAAPIQAYTKPAARSAAEQMREFPAYVSRRPVVAPVVAPPTAAVAEGRRSTRTFSYAPGTTAQVMRCSPPRVPSYMLPKSDPRKYNGF